MDSSARTGLNQLLGSSDAGNREVAWEGLIGHHTRLLMAVARSFGGDYDNAMERYSYILGKLRENDFRRLRSYDENAGATFATWLTVAARNLCLDLHRSRFGRSRGEDESDKSISLRAARRALTDLTEGSVSTDSLPDPRSPSAEDQAVRQELDACLREAVAELNPRDRLLLSLRFEDGYSAARIARIVDMPTPFHVYRRLSAILRQLRNSLRARGIDGPDG